MGAPYKNALARVLLLSVFAHSLIPAGFMPGSIGAGEWMMLCPQDSVLLHSNGAAHHRAEHSHHESHSPSALAGDACDFQDALVQVLHGSNAHVSLALPARSLEASSFVRATQPGALVIHPWDPRAPPV
ncbi:MAG: hypothetical protein AAFN07_10880 [Pseudomonadota bacterium]